jgi:hypothetical protein
MASLPHMTYRDPLSQWMQSALDPVEPVTQESVNRSFLARRTEKATELLKTFQRMEVSDDDDFLATFSKFKEEEDGREIVILFCELAKAYLQGRMDGQA